MIFASDLDRTLIYSGKFIEDCSVPYKTVEEGDYSSYMTRRAAKLLTDLAKEILFIPCTTRTVEQYLRVKYIQELKPKYAVVSNGGNLLIDGSLDREYQKELRLKLNDCLPAADLLKEFDKISSQAWVIKIKEADSLFYYCIVDRLAIPFEELSLFRKWAKTQQWEVSLQGRKLYLMPRVINKWAPIEKIIKMSGKTRVYTAGDSLLDLPLLTGTANNLSPSHGELHKHYTAAEKINKSKINFTSHEGIKAGEEILEEVIKWTKTS